MTGRFQNFSHYIVKPVTLRFKKLLKSRHKYTYDCLPITILYKKKKGKSTYGDTCRANLP